jgi:uncharacterized protein (DUF1697 family)
MPRSKYVALLRGINVGGKNPVPMAALREAFEAGGYDDVTTYIQSGNVLFSTDRAAKGLEDHVESLIEARFGIPILVVIRSERQLRSVITSAPDGFGTEPTKYHSDAVFLKAPLTAAKAMRVVQEREGVDRAWPGTGVIYFQRLSARRTTSKMSKIVGTEEYRSMTIRNWNTTTKLLALLDDAGRS